MAGKIALQWRRSRRVFPADLPGQFRLLVGGSLLSSTGYTLSFPFLTLYLNVALGIPLERIGLLFIVNAAAGLMAQALAGPAADGLGRKPVMMAGLLASGAVAVGFTQASSFEQFVLLAALNGFFGSIFQPASNAMVIDLVGPERRAEAFGLMRVAANLGWVIGPTVGGLLATQSYTMMFLGTAVAELMYLALVVFFVKETLPPREKRVRTLGWTAGYGQALGDRPFMMFLAASMLITVVVTQLTTTMPVYLKQYAQVPESGYGLLMALNAGMVVVLQFPTTRLVQARNRAIMLALGSILYAVGFGSLGLWRQLPMFACSIAVLTAGEMIIAPVASALVADLSPADMRARYMALYGLIWTVGFGLGPAMGGAVLQQLGPGWLWSLSFVACSVGGLSYLLLPRYARQASGNR